MSWRDEAACRGMDANVFIPDNPFSGPLRKRARDSIERAMAVCRSCPVTRECLAFAVSMGEVGGVWGGLYLTQKRLARLRGDNKRHIRPRMAIPKNRAS